MLSSMLTRTIFFFRHIVSLCYLLESKHCAPPSVFLSLLNLLKFFSCPFQKWSRVSYRKDYPGSYPFDEIPAVTNKHFKRNKQSRINECISLDIIGEKIY